MMLTRKIFGLFGIEQIIDHARDWRFWLLFYIINISGNLGFIYYISEPISVILIFAFTFPYIVRRGIISRRLIIFSFSFFFILLIQPLYVEYFSLSTTIHYVLEICIAVALVAIIREKILIYFPAIICFYCVISLFCFSYNLMGGVVPHVQITETSLDGGIIMRVFNPFYTQIASPGGVSLNAFRNCGPFWEPGAFQGYINLAFFLDMLSKNIVGAKKRYLIFILAVISTLSTGGYIVLFFNIIYLMIHGEKSFSNVNLLFLMLLFCSIAIYAFITLPFLGEKISENEDRLTFSLDSFDTMHLLFGYGYDPRSFSSSSMGSASSVFNIFRYVGVVGFIVYMIALYYNNCKSRIYYSIILFLILMNEPFLQFSFWWAAPLFIFNSKKSQYNISGTSRNN